MTNLYAVSQVSDLLILDILAEMQESGGDVVVLATNQHVSRVLYEKAGIHSQLAAPLGVSQETYTERFLNDKSPVYGELAGMPLWKLLGIDRLGFWHYPFVLEIKQLFSWHSQPRKLTISLDINSPEVWAMAQMAKEIDIPVCGIQVHPLRTREMYDMARALPLDEIVVSYLSDSLFFQGHMDGEQISVYNVPPATKRRAVVQAEASNLRNALSSNPVGIVFDKRDEWQFRKYMDTTPRKNVIIFTRDGRSDQLFTEYFSHRFVGLVYTDMKWMAACREVVLFRFDEDLIYKFVPEDVPVRIVDYNDVNLAQSCLVDGDINITAERTNLL